MSLHVVFGAGPVGRSVVERLLVLGEPVRLVTRGKRPAWLDGRAEHLSADATLGSATRAACLGATHVYNCTNAAQYHRWPAQFPPLQRGVLEGARANGAVLVAVENLYVYGPHQGVPMNEGLELKGNGLRSTTRVEMTHELDEAHRRGDVRVVRVRASDLIGPGVLESMAGERLFGPILSGQPSVRVMADPALPHAITSVRDFAQTLVAAALDQRAHGLVIHAPSLAPTPLELVTAIAAEAGLARPKVVASSRRATSLMLPIVGLFFPELRGLRENVYMFYEPFVVDHSRAAQLLGLAPSPLGETIRATLDWYRESGGAR